jgi:transposase
MNKKTRRQPTDWREARRLRARELHPKGWKQKDSAEARDVTRGAVSQWGKRGQEAGPEALRGRRGGGPRPRLSEAQLTNLCEHLAQGAEHFSFRGDVWTQSRVAELIKRKCGVT